MIVKSYSDIKSLERFINDNEILALDIETDGLNPRKNIIIGFGISSRNRAFYIPTYEYSLDHSSLIPSGLNKELILKILNKLKDKKLVTWNGSFDLPFIKTNFNIDLINQLYVDGMLLKHTVDEEYPFGLKEVAVRVLGASANQEQTDMLESIKQNGGSKKEYYKADPVLLAKYCMADCILTFKLYEYYLKELNKQGQKLKDFFFTEVMPLYREVTIPMEERGILLDLPLMKECLVGIQKDMSDLEDKIQTSIAPNLGPFKTWYLNKEFEPKRSGDFAQAIARYFKLDLPKTKTGKFTLTEKVLSALPESRAKKVLLKEAYLYPDELKEVQEMMWKETQKKYMFNLLSKHHLKKLFFEKLKERPINTTDKGNPQVDEEFLEQMSLKYEWCKWLIEYNKLAKIKGTYIERFLEEQEDGRFYPRFMQHGTVSGRYSGNLQQLPRPLEDGVSPVILKYVNQIRKFFIADPETCFIDADYESLEPHVFAHVSGDERLKNIFRQGLDFYSEIAIKTERISQYSSDKNATNYLGKVNKALRQKSKSYCLAADTLIDTDKGLVTIQNIKVGNSVLSSLGYKKVTNTFSRISKVLRVHTNRGIIECTPDHKFYINGKWIEAQELTAGMPLTYSASPSDVEILPKLPIKSNMQFSRGGNRPLGYLDLDSEWAYIVGAIIGDGIISIKQTPNEFGHGIKGYVGICGLEADGVVDKVSRFMADLGFPLKDRSASGKRCKTYVCINSELCKIFYDTLQLGDTSAKHKVKNLKVPDYILNSPIECKVAFLAGLLDTDGYVKKIGKKTRICSLTSKDSRLTTGVIKLLQSIGVISTMEPQWNKTYNKWYWTIKIPVQGMLKLRELGIQNFMVVGRKREAFETVQVHIKKSQKVPQVLRVEHLEKSAIVYDITVEDSHNFYANGILVHNCLGVPYGMSGYKLQFEIGVSQEEAESLVEDYLTAFPDLRTWMENTARQVKNMGWVASEVGRIRHMPKAVKIYQEYGDMVLDSLELWKEYHNEPELYERAKEHRAELKNFLNNGNNFQIQSLSASIVNRAAIEINRWLKSEGIDGRVVAQIHDQIITSVPERYSLLAKQKIQDIMENTYKLSIALKAPAAIGKNFYDAH